MNPGLLAVVAALGSALGFAVASVLQQRAAARQPKSESLKLGLLLRLVKSPVWVGGIGAEGLAYVLQFVALGHQSLVVVQPLLVSGLLFALPLGAVLSHHRITRRDLMGAALIVVGLSAFLLAAAARPGRPDASTLGWLLLGAFGVAGIGALVLLSRSRTGEAQAMLLGAAAGLSTGLAAALTKASAHLLAHGLVHALTAWQPYALLASGAVGMILAQSAFEAGPLEASLPILTVADPLASIAIGAFLLGESIKITGIAPLLEIAGLVALIAGVFWLGRSPAVVSSHKKSPAPRPLRAFLKLRKRL